jgi:uncharacterized protein
MILPISLTAAGAAALLNIWLAWRVSQVRRARKIAHGDGGDALMTRRMRAHANYVEYAPFFLILLALLELAGALSWALWAAVAVFFAARVAHPFGMDRDGAPPLRIAGVVGTWLTLVGLAGWAIVLTYQGVTPAVSRTPATTAVKA